MDPTTQALLWAAALGFVRHALTGLGGILLGLGALTPGQEISFVDIGAGLFSWGVGYAWSVYQKKGVVGMLDDFKRMKKHLSYATLVPPSVPQAGAINSAIAIAQKGT